MPVQSPASCSASYSNANALPLARPRPRWAAALKRTLDLLGAAFGLLLSSPLLLIIATLIKVQDGGPVFHRRRVVGRFGPFDAFKFRSMRPDADAVLHADPALQKSFQQQFKLTNDPRITPLGWWLRKYSLDELPQLFNVLRGQMSLVGPRMITPAELQKYGQHQSLLLSVKPGLTGLWQVSGRQNVDYQQRVVMDVSYIQNWSLSLDLLILLRTPRKVFQAEGAF